MARNRATALRDLDRNAEPQAPQPGGYVDALEQPFALPEAGQAGQALASAPALLLSARPSVETDSAREVPASAVPAWPGGELQPSLIKLAFQLSSSLSPVFEEAWPSWASEQQASAQQAAEPQVAALATPAIAWAPSDQLTTLPMPESGTDNQSPLNQLPNYNLSLALDAVLLSQVAYENVFPLGSLGTWAPLQPAAGVVASLTSNGGYRADNGFLSPWTSNSAYAFAASRMAGSTKEYVITFAGTDFGDRGDLQTDFQTYGFTNYYKAMQPLFAEVLLQALADKDDDQDVRVLVTGHSLGGAVAQAAFADLVINPALGTWSDPSAPLGVGQRLYNIPQVAAQASDIAGLVSQTQVITFGAPGLLINP